MSYVEGKKSDEYGKSPLVVQESNQILQYAPCFAYQYTTDLKSMQENHLNNFSHADKTSNLPLLK